MSDCVLIMMDLLVNCNIVILILFIALTSVQVAAFAPQVCKADEWTCSEGTCIEADQICNGAIDCPDASDETFLLCRNVPCSGFKCVYGGCVPSNAVCNGMRDCADNSDELLYQCRNETTYLDCVTKIPYNAVNFLELWEQCKRPWRTCKDGQVLDNFQKCDGNIDCRDGSDETLETCATDQRFCKRLSHGPKFRCNYGACVDQSAICNGVTDCADGSDELYGLCHPIHKENEKWECNDGTHIKASKKCDGAIDCPDSSDETFINCRNNSCPNAFRCVYGGCVKNSLICNGVSDCIDGSDELLTKCRNEQTEVECHNILRWKYQSREERLAGMQHCADQDKSCKNGQMLQKSKFKCDGRVHCQDGSDEDLDTCATDRHNCFLSGNFRCKHGGCIDKSKVCNKRRDCADGSDEYAEICNVGRCLLPDYPTNGNYTVNNKPDARPGQDLLSVKLMYSCEAGYALNAPDPYVSCNGGSWAKEPLKCIIQCYLNKDPSIEYLCLSQDPQTFKQETECGNSVPDGMIIHPKCREPNYHYTDGVLTLIRCINGQWDRQVPICSPNCGLVTPKGAVLMVDGVMAERGELPWHAAIYKKPLSASFAYEQVCGGSLITTTLIVSAAHCFWLHSGLMPAERYAVALGKIYRPWNSPRDMNVHKSDVSRIIVPDSFHGSLTNFQDDIALVMLTNAVQYQPHLRPVCLDFNDDFEQRQLVEGKTGKVTGWGLTAEDGRASFVLKVAQLSYIDFNRCYLESPDSFRMFITSDKFCAGSLNESMLCRGDSGGGLVFPTTSKRGEQRYYLRGVVSSKAQNEHLCNIHAHTTFTKITSHQVFIQNHLDKSYRRQLSNNIEYENSFVFP